jgi:hypothetical protein
MQHYTNHHHFNPLITPPITKMPKSYFTWRFFTFVWILLLSYAGSVQCCGRCRNTKQVSPCILLQIHSNVSCGVTENSANVRSHTFRLASQNWEKSYTVKPCIPISRPTDATCDRFLFSIYMYTTLHVSSVKRSSSVVPHCTYSLQFLCLCPSAALSCKKLSYKKFSYKTVPRTDTNTETGGCMYSEGLLMMSAWRSKHVELYTYR